MTQTQPLLHSSCIPVDSTSVTRSKLSWNKRTRGAESDRPRETKHLPKVPFERPTATGRIVAIELAGYRGACRTTTTASNRFISCCADEGHRQIKRAEIGTSRQDTTQWIQVNQELVGSCQAYADSIPGHDDARDASEVQLTMSRTLQCGTAKQYRSWRLAEYISAGFMQSLWHFGM